LPSKETVFNPEPFSASIIAGISSSWSPILSQNNISNTFFLPSGLQNLILSSNYLDYKGLGRLLESLIFHPNKMNSLDISNNPVHQLLRFDDILKANHQLKDLFCENIGLHDDEIPAIIEALKGSGLNTVSFDGNPFTDTGFYRLRSAIAESTIIENLDA
jgi:hypothetical protein